MAVITLLVALALGAVHLASGSLHLRSLAPRPVWLSGAGGVGVAYVFLHLLPDLAAHRDVLADALEIAGPGAERLVFAVALAGLTVFYGIEHLALGARRGATDAPAPDEGGLGARAFWGHLGAFGAYNLLIGYLLGDRAAQGAAELALYGLAMGTHFLTADFGLRAHHAARFDRHGRWLLAGAVLLGWGMALWVALPPMVIAVLFAFLAGSMMLNVLKDELPGDRDGRFWAFVLGVAGYAALLAAV